MKILLNFASLSEGFKVIRLILWHLEDVIQPPPTFTSLEKNYVVKLLRNHETNNYFQPGGSRKRVQMELNVRRRFLSHPQNRMACVYTRRYKLPENIFP